MHRNRYQRTLVVTLSLLMLLTPLSTVAQPPNCQPSSVEPFVDNRDGYLVNFEEPPIHPLELSFNGRRLYAANVPDGRVSVFDISSPGSPQLIREVAVGLGPVSLRRRPPQNILPVEPVDPLPLPVTGGFALKTSRDFAQVVPAPVARHLWVVCMSSNAIFIVDEVTLRVVDSVRLTHRPADLVFDAAGKTAYVSLSDSNQIIVLDADNPHAPMPPRIEFESEMPLGSNVAVHVEEPRTLMRDGNDVYALSFLSGNGSTAALPSVTDPQIEQQWDFWPALPEPPDRDVLRLDLTGGSPGATAALWRMGTINFDLAKGGPHGDFYVSSLDMRNLDSQLEGEPEYQQEAFALHTVSHAAPSVTGAPQAGTVTIDLNDPANHAPGLVSSGFRCAMPNDLHFTSDNSKLFVACGDSRTVALLDANTDQVIAEFKATAGTRGFGIRGVLLNRSERWLYAYGRGDTTLLVFDTANLVAGAPNPPQQVLSLGWDITPNNVVAGRFHFLDGSNSNDGVSTCNTCHIDGHLDGIAWDLSDFTGDTTITPRDVPRVPKGGKTTMSLLGIEETPPFHWRGDRADLDAFNPAFEGLLGGSQLDDTPGGDLDDFLDFVFTLSYPPSPHQNLDRTYSTNARIGFDCFESEIAHDLTSDTTGLPPNPPTSGVIALTCEQCHSMAGGSGTLNQVNNPIRGLLADDATQLRGVWDKESDTVDYDPVISCPSNPYCNGFVNEIPATGWGLANTGFVDTIFNFVSLGVFSQLPTGSQDEISQFILEMDTGSAPTTAAAHQLDGTLAGGGALPSPLKELVAGTTATAPATVPANDLIARGWVMHQGSPRSIGMLYDPTATPTAVFVTDTVDNTAAGCTADASVAPGANGIGPFSLTQLDAMVAAGQAVLTVIGTPVGSGYRLGLDRDMDCLRDGDEAAHGTVANNPDFDRDRFPDGYEVRLGSDPTLMTSVPSDNTAPIVPLGGSTIAWKNSNVMKVRWETDEESKSRLRVFDTSGVTPVLVFSKTEGQFKRQHVMLARDLKPGRSYSAEAETEDPSVNQQTFQVGGDTTQSHLFESVHVADTTLTHLGPSSTPGLEQYQADFHIVREDGTDSVGAEVTFTLVEWVPGQGSCVSTDPGACNQALVTAPAGAGGIATLVFDGKLDFQAQGGFTEAFATDVGFATSGADVRLYFHSLDGQCGHWDQEGLYGLTPSHPCL